MLEVAHRVTSPESGRPLCLGAFASANVLVDEAGRVSFLGWGHPHHPAVRARMLSGLRASFVAPETSFGAEPQPGSDLTAATLFFHSFLSLGELPEPVVAAMRGEATPGHERLPALVVELMANSHAARPEDRSIPRFLDTFRRILDDLGLVPDREAFRRDLVELASSHSARAQAPRLLLGPEARWFQLEGGEIARLDRRGALRRVLTALTEAVAEQLVSPGVHSIFDAWCIADLDLAFALQRLLANGCPMPERLRAYTEAIWERPSVREFVAHSRPPHPLLNPPRRRP
jgi:hypothetical protein